MLKDTFHGIKAEVEQAKMYWTSDPEFRRNALIWCGKGLLASSVIIASYIYGRKEGFNAGHLQGSKKMLRTVTNILNEYNVQMPEAMRQDIINHRNNLPWVSKF